VRGQSLHLLIRYKLSLQAIVPAILDKPRVGLHAGFSQGYQQASGAAQSQVVAGFLGEFGEQL